MSELVQRRKALTDELMRTAICDAGAAVLAEVGFAALTMDRVAEAADVSKGTLYNYFRDKDALVVEVAERTYAPLRQETERIFAERPDHGGSLIRGARIILAGIVERRALGRVLCVRELPALENMLFAKRMRLHRLFADAFTRAAAAGLLREPCEHPEQLGRCLALAMHGMIDLHIHHPDVCPTVEEDVLFLERYLIRPWFKGTPT